MEPSSPPACDGCGGRRRGRRRARVGAAWSLAAAATGVLLLVAALALAPQGAEAFQLGLMRRVAALKRRTTPTSGSGGSQWRCPVAMEVGVRASRLAPLRTAAAATAEDEEEDMAVHAAADKSVAQMFSKPLRVGLLVEPTPFTHVSGYANRFKEMLKHLHRSGDTVEVMTTDDVPNAPTRFLEFPVHYTPGFRFPLYKHICLTFDVKMCAYHFLRAFRPQLLHVATPGFFCIAAAIYARLLRIPLVFSYHTHLPIYARDYLGFVPGIVGITKFVIRMVHNAGDMTLVTSPQLKAELESFGVKRVHVWKKGIDTERFNPAFRSAEMRARLTDGHPEDPLLIYVGRLGAEKKLKTLRGVLERIPNARLAIVGAGPAEAELHEYFKGTRTVFTGLLHGRELSEAFASADVFLMPSDSETLGFVILESMASGVPVIGADAGGIPNVIEHGATGYLVPVGDDAAFAQRVEELLADPALMQRMRAAGRAEAERLDWGSAMAHLRNVHYKRAVLNFRSRLNLRGRLFALPGKIKSGVTEGVQGLFATAT